MRSGSFRMLEDVGGSAGIFRCLHERKTAKKNALRKKSGERTEGGDEHVRSAEIPITPRSREARALCAALPEGRCSAGRRYVHPGR